MKSILVKKVKNANLFTKGELAVLSQFILRPIAV